MSRRDQDAVQTYLNELLEESGTGSSPAPVAEVALQEQLHALEQIKRQQLQKLLDRQMPVTAAAVAPAAVAPGVAPVELSEGGFAFSDLRSAPAESAATVAEPHTSPLLQWCENGRPVWAQGRFDVLLFQVAGLTLAVPLIALGQIYPINDNLSRIFGQADWFMGLLPTPAGQLRTVNTALFVMPERYDPAFAQSVRYVVSIDGLDWGLAVDKVQQPTRLQPEDVTWRTERGKRPWLAGTVKSAMCALLDIPQMGRTLQEQDRKRSGSKPR
jgi:purine-binding chemotaxis protein CheW